jgi:DNA-binding protein H-NS
MNEYDFESMSTDRLWTLHEMITATLVAKITAEKAQLDQRLCELNQGVGSKTDGAHINRARRPYPKVFPKFQNPARPSETWAGRGRKPRWLTAQLNSGNRMDDFRISADLPGNASGLGTSNISN